MAPTVPANTEQIDAACLYIQRIDAMYEDAAERSEFLSESYYQQQRAIANQAVYANPEDAPGVCRPS